MKNNLKLIVFILFLTLIFVITDFVIFIAPSKKTSLIFKNDVKIEDITFVSKIENVLEVVIIPSKEESFCSLDNDFFMAMEDNQCHVFVSKSGESVISFKDRRGIISESFTIDNYVLDNTIDDKYYLALGSEVALQDKVVYIGKKELSYNYDREVISVLDNKITALKRGKTHLEIKYNDEVIKTSEVIVTDLIVNPTINGKKKQLGCNVYLEDEADLLDEILAARIEKAGYGTRAGVVAGARFLTLEFPYQIPYFYENGRLHESSTHHADGEGRYYHQGLYLHKSKFSSIVKRVAGPAIWGCYLTNYEPDPPNYIPLEKKPNGLDCSGFVSWVILNGGFDIGDLGAGPTNYNYELPDTGEMIKLTKELIDTKSIKPGDLLSASGHIAIIIGIDENNIYVAESLPMFSGLVANIYNKNKIAKFFSNVVLMDRVYEIDGNLTYMW